MIKVNSDEVILEAVARYGMLYADKINVGFKPNFANNKNSSMAKEISKVNEDIKQAYLEIIKLARDYVALFAKETPQESIPLLHTEIESILDKHSWYDELYMFENEPRRLIVKSLDDVIIIHYYSETKNETYDEKPISSTNYKKEN